MTERRATISLNWRPAGTPARRIDDFAELPHLPTNDVPAPAAPARPDRREIGLRLENWARWNNANESRGPSSQTGAICERLRRAAEGTATTSGERRSIDEQDALLLERGMRELETRHRMLLWWCYIRQAMPEVVCRKMGIAHRPSTVFLEQFYQAQAAIESVVEKNMEKQG